MASRCSENGDVERGLFGMFGEVCGFSSRLETKLDARLIHNSCDGI